MWDLPGPGLKPVSPALAGGFLTTAQPGKPLPSLLTSKFTKHKILNSVPSALWRYYFCIIWSLLMLLKGSCPIYCCLFVSNSVFSLVTLQSSVLQWCSGCWISFSFLFLLVPSFLFCSFLLSLLSSFLLFPLLALFFLTCFCFSVAYIFS